MRHFVSTIAGAALASAVATAAGADTVLASNPSSFTNFFFEQGMPSHLTTNSAGDPFIEFQHEGKTHPLFFYDCLENEDCLAVQLYAGYKMAQPYPLERLNEWNSGDRRFMRAYLTPDDNVVHLEMDVATSANGISMRDFNDLLVLWLDRVEEFEEFIGW